MIITNIIHMNCTNCGVVMMSLEIYAFSHLNWFLLAAFLTYPALHTQTVVVCCDAALEITRERERERVSNMYYYRM